MYCTNCGKIIEGNARYCNQCGEKVEKENIEISQDKLKKAINNGQNIYVECPNCKEKFDNKEKYADWKTFIGINKFLCKNCKMVFKYPSHKKYLLDLIIGIIFWICSVSIPITPGEITDIALLSCFGIAGIALTIQGIWGLIENPSLKSRNPDWENRIHNTRYSK